MKAIYFAHEVKFLLTDVKIVISVEYSGIDGGQRFSGKKFFGTEKDAEDEMDRLMEDEKNDTISIHMGSHALKSFIRGYR